jgi:hypothetical protein
MFTVSYRWFPASPSGAEREKAAAKDWALGKEAEADATQAYQAYAEERDAEG